MRAKRQAVLPMALLLGSCVATPRAAPPPAPRRAPPPAPTPPPPPVATTDWRDVPLTPGDWRYQPVGGGSVAQFGEAGQGARFAIRCDAATRRLTLSRSVAVPVAQPTVMAFTTSFGTFAYPAALGSGIPPALEAAVAAVDPNLDKLAFSRGRFIVGTQGQAQLVVPVRPALARVVEDCRG